MSLLAESLLRAAGFEYDEIEETWVARMPLRPLVAVECDEGRAYIREALMEVQATLDAIGCVYKNFVVNDRFVSVAGAIQSTMCGNATNSLVTEPSSPLPLLVSGADRQWLPAIAPIAPYDTVEIIDSNPPLKQLCSSA
jgi:hypothetical protein